MSADKPFDRLAMFRPGGVFAPVTHVTEFIVRATSVQPHVEYAIEGEDLHTVIFAIQDGRMAGMRSANTTIGEMSPQILLDALSQGRLWRARLVPADQSSRPVVVND